MNINKGNRIFFIIFSLIIFSTDQISKYLIYSNYKSIINKDLVFFRLELIKNYGAAFNIFSGNRNFLSIVSLLISILLIYLLIRDKNTRTLELYSYSFILGGTMGNGIDRIINGYVIDFISLKFVNFPVFNIADISINIGFLIILYSIFSAKSKIWCT